MHNGLNNNLGNLFTLSNAKSRSVCPENPTGGKGMGGACELGDGSARLAARDLGKGWKVNPYVNIPAGETYVMADIDGPGCIQHIWLTPTGRERTQLIRFYWDGQAQPSVECPLGDFFASGIGYAPITSLAVCVNPGSAYNSYWQMPFRKRCRITLENLGDAEVRMYYQVDYILTDVPADAAYFHAQFRRTNPLPYKQDYVILDGVRGKGQYVGTHMCWGVNSNGWWGEGEIKFFLDGDGEYPTICGTGTEDYFCGSYNFENRKLHRYETFTSPYSGLSNVTESDNLYSVQKRFAMYRWHIADPIYFDQDLKVTIQALGWRSGKRYLPLQDDISSVAYWYQTLPAAPFPKMLAADELEIV